jgi:hypothetical protein
MSWIGFNLITRININYLVQIILFFWYIVVNINVNVLVKKIQKEEKKLINSNLPRILLKFFLKIHNI